MKNLRLLLATAGALFLLSPLALAEQLDLSDPDDVIRLSMRTGCSLMSAMDVEVAPQGLGTTSLSLC